MNQQGDCMSKFPMTTVFTIRFPIKYTKSEYNHLQETSNIYFVKQIIYRLTIMHL